jgi:ABC-type amino acid transport substrate-binding protein
LLVKDGKVGWSGLMGEITKEKADAILAPFTIDPERAEYVEFSNPYKFKGISILVKRVNNLDLSI